MSLTKQYYNQNAQQFFDATLHLDVNALYTPFLPHIPLHGTILDAGCGSGRDSKHFLDLGFKVVSFDASETLAALASEHLGQNVIQASFGTFEAAPSSFDGIWACASLLHLPYKELENTFSRLSALLKPTGIFYCSFKYGTLEQIRNGRFFTDMNEQKLQEMLVLTKLGIKQTWISTDVRAGREAEQWLNAILIKI